MKKTLKIILNKNKYTLDQDGFFQPHQSNEKKQPSNIFLSPTNIPLFLFQIRNFVNYHTLKKITRLIKTQTPPKNTKHSQTYNQCKKDILNNLQNYELY